MRVDVVDGRVQVRHHLDAHFEGQVFGVPILFGGVVEVKASIAAPEMMPYDVVSVCSTTFASARAAAICGRNSAATSL